MGSAANFLLVHQTRAGLVVANCSRALCHAGKVSGQAPGDMRRRAAKLLDAQRWREAVKAEAAPSDNVLLRAAEGLAGQLRQVWQLLLLPACTL